MDSPSVPVRTRYAPGSFAELLSVAIPLIISSGSVSLMHSIDRVFLSWYSQEALAASMPAGLFNWLMMSLAYGTVLYVNTFVAQYHGAGRKDRVAASLWQGIYLATLFGLFLAAIAPFLSLLFSRFGHDPKVQELEVTLFCFYSFGSPIILINTALTSFYSGRGAVTVVMWSNICALFVNAILDYLLIFGIEGVIPAYGVTGAAVATIAGYVASCAFMVLLINLAKGYHAYPFRQTFGFDRELAGRMLRHGFPTGMQMFVDIVGIMAFLLVVGNMGTIPLVASNLAFSLNSLTFIPLMGLGITVTTLVGQRIGEKRPDLAEKTAWMTFGLGFLYMSVWITAYLAIPETLMYPYLLHATKDVPEIQAMTTILLHYVCIYTFFDGCATIFGGAIRGAGDTHFPAVLTVITSICLLLIPMLILGYFGTTLHIAWWVISIYIIVLGVSLLLRFLTGKWKHMTVMEHSIIVAPAYDMESPAEHIAELTMPLHAEDLSDEKQIAKMR